MVELLPPEEAGRAVLDEGGAPFRGDPEALSAALTGAHLRFHQGAIRGAVPEVRARS